MKPPTPIRLYWGENYAPKPQIVLDALHKTTEATIKNIHLYPGSLYSDTKTFIAKTHGVTADNVIIGHGIEGLIHLICQTFLDKTTIGGMFDPSFYVMKLNLERYPHFFYPIGFDTPLKVSEVIAKIQKTALFFVTNPNTTTGNIMLTVKQLDEILQHYKGILVIDECYFGISDITALALTKKYDNLLILRGVSKVMGLASLRFGYAIGNKQLIDALAKNLTDLEDPASSFSLRVFQATFPYFNLLKKTRKDFFAAFMSLMRKEFPHDTFLETQTNFYYMDISKYPTQLFAVMNYLNHQGYLMENRDLKDNSSLTYPHHVLQLTPPPKEYWEDFIQELKNALKH